MSTQIHHLGVGDEGPSLGRQALLNGEPLTLSAPVTFTLHHISDMDTPMVGYSAATAVLVDGPTGQLRFDFPTPPALPAGKYLGRFRALNGAGDIVSVPNEGHILVLVSG
jgi:hypothetical protein